MNVNYAIGIAAQRHRGAKYGPGPYIRHPLRVMEAVAPYGEDAMVVAVLHDVLEDTGALYPWEDERLTEVQREALWLLTRDPKEDYQVYIDRLAKEYGPAGTLARLVKLADLRDNLSNLDALRPARRERLERRYHSAIRDLA